MALTLKQVEAFNAVMSAGGVTRAAEMLGVSQPAISRIIADFEASVGFPLFLRSSRTLVPTARGRALHAEVERAFLGLAHIETIAAGLRERGEGQLRLVVVPSLLPMVSKELIAPFVARFPAASVSVEVAAALNTIDWAAARQADVGITIEDLTGPSIVSEPIGTTAAACVVPAGHPLARLGRPIHARDLEGLVFISYKPDSTFRAEVDRVLAAAGVSRDLRVEARTTAAVCELVASLAGVAIVPSSGPHLAADARLAVRPFEPRLESKIALVRPVGVPLSPLATSFVEMARDKGIDFKGTLTVSPRRSSRRTR
jgi:DNA-binding transcriptional LysR family regulator